MLLVFDADYRKQFFILSDEDRLNHRLDMMTSDIKSKVNDIEVKMEKSGFQNDGLPLDQKYVLSLEEAALLIHMGII